MAKEKGKAKRSEGNEELPPAAPLKQAEPAPVLPPTPVISRPRRLANAAAAWVSGHALVLWLISNVASGFIGAGISKLVQDQPKVVLYYRGAGQRLRSGSPHKVAVAKEQQKTTIMTMSGGPASFYAYYIGPFEVGNEGKAVTPKEIEARLECSGLFKRNVDPGHAKDDPPVVWQGSIRNPLVEGPGNHWTYEYKKHITSLGPGQRVMLYGLGVEPQDGESQNQCDLVVYSGTDSPTRLSMSFMFESR